MIKINLLPRKARRMPTFALPSLLPALTGLWPAVGAVCALIILGMGWSWWSLGTEAARLREQNARVQRELALLQTIITEGNRFKREKEDLERRLELVDIIAQNQARPVYLLDAIAGTVPRNLWLTKAEEKEDQLTLAGAAFSPFVVAEFMANLRKSERFHEVDVVIAEQDLDEFPRVVTFEVTATFGI
ncbi:MAG: PilN domain-containing protein [Candidatus Methylomirabilia bacterium]